MATKQLRESHNIVWIRVTMKYLCNMDEQTPKVVSQIKQALFYALMIQSTSQAETSEGYWQKIESQISQKEWTPRIEI